ncbi:Ubiquitin-conjugating enzyme/RWD-like protein [Gracilaria domingensis]|nr:Ubiquitin-conjugating enzyme/RWD-like protein [Gracilaria domingensis]
MEEEIEAVSAIYGEENVSYSPRTASMPATVAIILESCVGEVQISAQIAEDYPATHPRPTLRTDALSVQQCEMLIERMMERQGSAVGEVCLFEYCETMLGLLLERQDELGNDTERKPRNKEEAIGTGTEQSFKIMHGEPLTDRKSVFQAHLAFVSSTDDVDSVLAQLCESKKVESATHNTMAWIVGAEEDFDDDGEKGAGKVMLHVLRQFEARNTLCIVSRWFGGVKLGPVRFRHIANVTRDILTAHEGVVKRGILDGSE